MEIRMEAASNNEHMTVQMAIDNGLCDKCEHKFKCLTAKKAKCPVYKWTMKPKMSRIPHTWKIDPTENR